MKDEIEFQFTPSNSLIINVEEWRSVVGFPDYEVSSLGRFRRLIDAKYRPVPPELRKELRGTLSHNGYIHIGLTRDKKQITKLAHRLVAEAFLEKPPGNVEVNHMNSIRSDNRSSNLEWVTRSQNQKHAWKSKCSKRENSSDSVISGFPT